MTGHGHGIVGTLLWVDLTSGRLEPRPIEPELLVRYLGGRGLAARLLWDLVSPGLAPFDERNPLIVLSGTLSGTPAPSSGRTTITCLSPATGLYLKTNAGGHFGAELKFAGFDGIVITGRAKTPATLWIHDGRAELRDASKLWGRTVNETRTRLREELENPELQVACIGPAGEHRVLYASIMLSPHNAAARGGLGAVMGDKRLKAIAVAGDGDGDGDVTVAQPEAFLASALAARRVIAEDPVSRSLFIFGTSGGVGPSNEKHRWPTRNFQRSYHEAANEVGGEHLKRGGYLRGRNGCSSCTTSCHRYSVAEFDGTCFASGGPEFETFGSLGAGLDISDIRYVIRGSGLCNDLGLDVISAGYTIQWAIESRERGVLAPEACDGFVLDWGNGEEMLALLELIARRKGRLGNLLADGTQRASAAIGGESWKWAVQANGLEQSSVETRIVKAYALAFAVNPRGPDHLTAEPMLPGLTTPAAAELMETLCGPGVGLRRDETTEKRDVIVRYHEDIYAALDALGLCAFTATCAYTLRARHLAELFSQATGIETSEEEIMIAGARIVELERAFNLRRGRDRRRDKIPWRILNDPVASGPDEGMTTSQGELDRMLDAYYDGRGWDVATGRPTRRSLTVLGLGDIADVLHAEDLLGPED